MGVNALRRRRVPCMYKAASMHDACESSAILFRPVLSELERTHLKSSPSTISV